MNSFLRSLSAPAWGAAARGLGRGRVLPALAMLAIAAGPLAACIAPAFAAPADHKFVTLRGRVTDASGDPIQDVRVLAGQADALTSADGRFELTIDLGSLQSLLLAPTHVSVRARQTGHHVVVAGGEPSLEFEVRVGATDGQPVMEARSNFGIIADALLDALAPPGERNAVLQVGFTSTSGAEETAVARLLPDRHAVSIAEPWIVRPEGDRAPPAVPRPAPPPRPRVSATPGATSATGTTPGKKATPERERKAAPAAPRQTVAKPAPAPPTSANRPVWTHADSVRIQRENEQRAATEAAQAHRDSLFRAQRAVARARKSVADSLRAIRDALEDSLRRARFGLPPGSRVVAAGPMTRDSARVQAAIDRKNRALEAKQAQSEQQRIEKAQKELERNEKKARRERKKQEQREARRGEVPQSEIEEASASPDPSERASQASSPAALRASDRVVSTPSSSSGLQRVEPRSRAASDDESEADVRARLGADSCGCNVRGTVEMEFHRLLSSPMKIEVALKELPAIRDTIELFMGSPRGFELRRVPCGRWSIALHPFSERPFGVTTPEEVAPFDCRNRALRQVRFVIAPL